MDHKVRTLTAVCGLALASAAFGQAWNEVGDAGDLPATAQIPEGTGPLTRITGTVSPDEDQDMYLIRIVDVGSFSASTVGTTSWDTQLFLFRADGVGVVHNDDHVGGATLQSTITSQFIPGPGDYLIAISRYDRDPYASGQLIWATSPFRAERTPDGPNPTGAVDSWNGTAFGTAGVYTIALTGAEFPSASCYADCDTSTGIGVLDIFDFLCFGNRFSAGDPYACDCDTSTGPNVCDIFDFLCFGNEFNAGCP